MLNLNESVSCPTCTSNASKLIRTTIGSDSWIEHRICTDCGRQMLPVSSTTPPLQSEPPPRFEDEYPELAETFRQVSNKEHPHILGIRIEETVTAIRVKVVNNGMPEKKWFGKYKPKIEASIPGRNDPCHCGSGLKFKKCHGK